MVELMTDVVNFRDFARFSAMMVMADKIDSSFRRFVAIMLCYGWSSHQTFPIFYDYIIWYFYFYLHFSMT